MLKNLALFCPAAAAAAVGLPGISLSTQLRLSAYFNVFVHIREVGAYTFWP